MPEKDSPHPEQLIANPGRKGVWRSCYVNINLSESCLAYWNRTNSSTKTLLFVLELGMNGDKPAKFASLFGPKYPTEGKYRMKIFSSFTLFCKRCLPLNFEKMEV